ncbi:hypothetical protein ME9_01558 [Bartonella taylorii 8TBB]|uniref:Uncharacterized protein n=1 Tax=Bartonella taylorii 8TBB TaxID=1094560 RepID=A0A9P2RX04_BARTA|nr:hypothetical protein ME9_01558 [Bartonella taylorii 8TBB]
MASGLRRFPPKTNNAPKWDYNHHLIKSLYFPCDPTPINITLMKHFFSVEQLTTIPETWNFKTKKPVTPCNKTL